MKREEVKAILIQLGSVHFTDSPGTFLQRHGESDQGASERDALSVLRRERDRLAEQLRTRTREYDELLRSMGSVKTLKTV
ncbi:hypothetical protein LZ24_00304 [Desulfobotulus alkaliphilus]|uniref:Uncharacterized protein n=1 Tax=Desulfobotulus alkaliphilus TaxID=622671 RepID=A0A562S9L4_9BACT|nr:hypothetical protein [Desulfobotulus alkaliphilus]TWI77494.1 hypothetical protein LZ24_00304 [Desulfobotulus alkaliphilus]